MLVMNPLKSRFSQGTVKTEPGTDVLYTFNRLWLDHCLTPGGVEGFALEPTKTGDWDDLRASRPDSWCTVCTEH